MTLPESIASAIHDHLMANLPPKQADFKRIVQSCLAKSKPLAVTVRCLKFFEQAHGQDDLAARTGRARADLERECGFISP